MEGDLRVYHGSAFPERLMMLIMNMLAPDAYHEYACALPDMRAVRGHVDSRGSSFRQARKK